MSKSLARVRAALLAARHPGDIKEVAAARTAQEAADAIGCALDQIAKSIVLRTATTGEALLFVTAGGNLVNHARAAILAGAPLTTADAALIRARTGFAIGGVAPVGHLSPIRTWIDPRLSDFDVIWAAAGTPRHVFAIAPTLLRDLTGAQSADFTT